MNYALASVEDDVGQTACVVIDGHVIPLEGRPTMLEVIGTWETWRRRIEALLADSRPSHGLLLDQVRLVPPVPEPPNIFMLGANYADHAREMGDVKDGQPVPKPAEGPFVFLKPTTTLVGQGAAVEIPAGASCVDWEVELAAVIGRAGRRIHVSDALDHVFGFTVINDVSVRDRFRRASSPPAMTFDWFSQKSWATTCPCGPVLVPSNQLPDPANLRLTLHVNGRAEQDGNTSDMIFDLREQIAYISDIVPLRVGDIISTGTPAGVGLAKGRFLSPGDVMVAEVAGIGRLENPLVAVGKPEQKDLRCQN